MSDQKPILKSDSVNVKNLIHKTAYCNYDSKKNTSFVVGKGIHHAEPAFPWHHVMRKPLIVLCGDDFNSLFKYYIIDAFHEEAAGCFSIEIWSKLAMKKAFWVLFLLAGVVLAGYERVVSLSPAITETIFALGRGERLIARSSACDRPKEAEGLPVAGNFAQINVERILALKPDCVITDSVMDASKAEPLKRAGIEFEVLSCATLEEYVEALKRLGELLDAPEEAKVEIAKVEAAMKGRVRAKGPRVLWVVWRSPAIIAGRGTLLDEALSLAGYRNAVQDKGYLKPGAERLLTIKCDILIADHEGGPPSEDPVLRFLSPVKRGRVLLIPSGSKVERPGPGFLDGVEELKAMLKKMAGEKKP